MTIRTIFFMAWSLGARSRTAEDEIAHRRNTVSNRDDDENENSGDKVSDNFRFHGVRRK